MAVCYNKLWKILIDKHMSKTQLIKEAKSVPMQWHDWEKIRMFVWKYL